jgi:hypothetical protein
MRVSGDEVRAATVGDVEPGDVLRSHAAAGPVLEARRDRRT